MPTLNDPPAHAPTKPWRRLVLPIGVFVISAAYFGYRLSNEPFFMDESATLAHTYYYRLMKEGRFNDIDWLHQASYDHLQFGRMLAGAAVDLSGFDVPTSVEPMEDWWQQSMSTGVKPPDNWQRLLAARWPMMIGAAFGCTMMFVVGRVLVGPLTGLLAAALLALSPLYARHGRIALADDWVQSLILAGLALWIAMSRRADEHPLRVARWLTAALAAGIAFGLAAQTKLNGGVGLAAIVVLVPLTLAFFPFSRSRPRIFAIAVWTAGSGLATLTAAAIFIGIHPYFYARPELANVRDRSPEWLEEVRLLASESVVGRVKHMLQHRSRTLDLMLEENRFPEASLRSGFTRSSAIVREGMGRWSAAGLAGWKPMLAAIPMLGLVFLGATWCVAEGRWQWRAGTIPYAWVIVTWPLVEIAVLLRGLTLDWDRYYMGVVCWSSLLAALGIGGTLTSVGRRLVLAPPSNNKQPAAPTPSSAPGEALQSGRDR